MHTFNVMVIREAGPDPMTSEFLSGDQEDLSIEAVNVEEAFRRSQVMSTLKFRGQIRRTFIDGEEYFDSRY